MIETLYKIFTPETITPYQTESLRLLWRETWMATYSHRFPKVDFHELLSTLNLPNLDTMLSGENIKIVSACVENKIVGSAIFKEVGTVAYLWGMYVLPSYQRQKIGLGLVKSVLEFIRDARFIQIYVLEESHAALLFYESLGFQKISTETISLSLKLSPTALAMRGDIKMMRSHLCLL